MVCVRRKTLQEIKCCPKAARSVISGKQPFMRTSTNESVRLGFTCQQAALPLCYFLSNKQIKLFATFLSYSCCLCVCLCERVGVFVGIYVGVCAL